MLPGDRDVPTEAGLGGARTSLCGSGRDGPRAGAGKRACLVIATQKVKRLAEIQAARGGPAGV